MKKESAYKCYIELVYSITLCVSMNLKNLSRCGKILGALDFITFNYIRLEIPFENSYIWHLYFTSYNLLSKRTLECFGQKNLAKVCIWIIKTCYRSLLYFFDHFDFFCTWQFFSILTLNTRSSNLEIGSLLSYIL